MNSNLKPQNTRTKDEQREIARMGGIASGEARRNKKSMRDRAQMLLSLAVKEGNVTSIEDVQNLKELEGKTVTLEEAMLIAISMKAVKGDVRSAEFIRDTAGEKPSEKIELTETNTESVRKMREYLYGEDTQSS